MLVSLSGRRAMFFLNPLQPARELLAIFCHFLGPIRVVRRARLERPANRILPDAKTRAPRPKVSCICGRALPDQCREAPPIPSGLRHPSPPKNRSRLNQTAPHQNGTWNRLSLRSRRSVIPSIESGNGSSYSTLDVGRFPLSTHQFFNLLPALELLAISS